MADQFAQDEGIPAPLALPAALLRIQYDPRFENQLREILVGAAKVDFPPETIMIPLNVPFGVYPAYVVPAPNHQVRFNNNEKEVRFICREHRKLYELEAAITANPVAQHYTDMREDVRLLLMRIAIQNRCLTYKLRVHVAARYHIQVMASYSSIGLDTTAQEQVLQAFGFLARRCAFGRCIGHFLQGGVEGENPPRYDAGNGGGGDDGDDGDDGGGEGWDGGAGGGMNDYRNPYVEDDVDEEEVTRGERRVSV